MLRAGSIALVQNRLPAAATIEDVGPSDAPVAAEVADSPCRELGHRALAHGEVGVLTLAGYEITLNVIAALLTIVGYSVNDTIVIFDRARENLRQHRKAPFATILNDSINQTLSRTLISSATTLFAVLGLYLFGGEVLRGFGFTMVVGILLGTYSTVYISCPIVVWWRGRGEKPSTSAKAA